MSEHNCFGDIADRYDGMTLTEWMQLPDSEIPYLDPDGEDPTLPVWQPEPVEDPSRYATMGDWAAILDHPCMPTRDHAGSYAQLLQRIPSVELTSDAATELRTRVTEAA